MSCAPLRWMVRFRKSLTTKGIKGSRRKCLTMELARVQRQFEVSLSPGIENRLEQWKI
jgi:hypothetical protein